MTAEVPTATSLRPAARWPPGGLGGIPAEVRARSPPEAVARSPRAGPGPAPTLEPSFRVQFYSIIYAFIEGCLTLYILS